MSFRHLHRRGLALSLAFVTAIGGATAAGCAAPAFAAVARTVSLAPVASVKPAGLLRTSAFVIDSAHHRGYLLDPLTKSLRVFDVNASAISPIASVALGSQPVDLAIDSQRSTVVVADQTDDSVKVVDVDPASPTVNTVTATYPTGGTDARAVAVDESTGEIYVANYASDDVTRMNQTTGAVTQVAVAAGPAEVVVDPSTHRAFAASPTSRSISTISGASASITTLSGFPTAIAFADDQLLVATTTPATPVAYAIQAFDKDMAVVAASSPLSEQVDSLTVDEQARLVYSVDISGHVLATRLGPLTADSSAPSLLADPVTTLSVEPGSHRVYSTLGALTGATLAKYDLLASPLVTSGAPDDGILGRAYSFQFEAVGSPSATRYVVTGTVPDGLALDESTGALTGTPTKAGSFRFRIDFINGVAPDTFGLYEMTVLEAAPAAPAITSGPPAAATVGTPYSFTVVASGFPKPSFHLPVGDLPPGLTLNTVSGEISGTPTADGSFTFTLRADNPFGSATADYTMSVAKAVGPTPTPTPPAPPTITPTPTTHPGTTVAGSGGSTSSGTARLASTGSDVLGGFGSAAVAILVGLIALGALRIQTLTAARRARRRFGSTR